MSSKTDAEWFTCRLAILAKNFEGSEKKSLTGYTTMWHHPYNSGKIRVTKTSLTDAGESIARKTTVSSTSDPPIAKSAVSPS
jgi:hypothetical protein